MIETPDLTKPDSLRRPYDAAKFLPKLDSIGRWCVRGAGRKPKSGGKSPSSPRKIAPAHAPKTIAELIDQLPSPMPEPTPTPTPASDVTPPPSTPPGTSQPPPEMNIGATFKFDDIEKAAADPLAETEREPTGSAVVVESVTTETVIGIIQTTLVLIGDDEGILTKTEKEMLRRPLKRVLDKYDIGEKMLPAEVDLAVCMATLLMVRLQKPKTATWFARVKHWFVLTFFKAKGAKLARDMRRDVGPIPQREPATEAATS